MVDPEGGLTSYAWDLSNRLSLIVNPWNQFTTIGYGPLDREFQKTLANGMQVSHLYDAAGRDLALWNVGPTGAGLAIYTALYDNANNRTSVQEIDGTRVTFGYDASYQLVNEQRSGVNAYNTTYLYDGVGNRTVKNDSGALTSYSYNVANEITLLTPPSGQPTTSLWDANGNLLSENAGGQLTSYSWDGENRLTGVAYPTGAPDTMVYSNDGLRQKKVAATATTNAVWDEQNLLQEKDQTGVTQAQYTDYPGYWGGLASQRRSGVSSFFGFDQQANARLLASNSGAQTDAYLFKAFGEELATSGVTVNPLRFGGMVGYYRDQAARLYIRARYYEPAVGRWVSRDPLFVRTIGDLTQYLYLSNAPTSSVDPTGLYDCDPKWLHGKCGGFGNNWEQCLRDAIKHEPKCRHVAKGDNWTFAVARAIMGCETSNLGCLKPFCFWTKRTRRSPPQHICGPFQINCTAHPEKCRPPYNAQKDFCGNIRAGVDMLCGCLPKGYKACGPGNWDVIHYDCHRCFAPCMMKHFGSCLTC